MAHLPPGVSSTLDNFQGTAIGLRGDASCFSISPNTNVVAFRQLFLFFSGLLCMCVCVCFWLVDRFPAQLKAHMPNHSDSL